MIVRHVSLRDFRSYRELELDLAPGLVLVTGPNGVGKTNLLEGVHVGSQGFSPRTRAEIQVIRFGAAAARVQLLGGESGVDFETEVEVRHGTGKRIRLNGAPVPATDELRTRLSTLVFSPDRLAVVKGGPVVRRMYFDRMLGRLFPARAALPVEYGRALGHRNAALRRVKAGQSSLEVVDPWTRQLAELGAALDKERAALVRMLEAGFGRYAELLGLRDVALVYEERGLAVADLEARLDKDVDRALTGVGPHLRDVEIAAGGRELRSYGSQGEQRAAVLALVLAEASFLADRRPAPPLLLLDDVLSELDDHRRLGLLTALPANAQTVASATHTRVLPTGAPEPALVVVVSPGEAKAA